MLAECLKGAGLWALLAPQQAHTRPTPSPYQTQTRARPEPGAAGQPTMPSTGVSPQPEEANSVGSYRLTRVTFLCVEECSVVAAVHEPSKELVDLLSLFSDSRTVSCGGCLLASVPADDPVQEVGHPIMHFWATADWMLFWSLLMLFRPVSAFD